MSGDFTQTLIAAAQKKPARIVLPESEHPGVLAAAAKAQTMNIAECILLGDATQIKARADSLAISLPDSICIMQPPFSALAAPLAKLRANKGLDEAKATAWLQASPIAAAAMMVRQNLADGMTAGAATSSADVLRPILQIIGKANNAPLASSFFLMDMPNGVAVFADCALNLRPTAEELAAIAKQSADNARRFGIAPSVAMLSYATGDSASSDEVSRVASATTIAQKLMPDIPVFGPIQYDAAVSPAIAAIKAPQWVGAGCANVFIFPDIGAGNIAYKAVQQTANIAAIGPLMQGLSAPANDLSRGATADDIFYTIAATVLQAGETI